MHTVLHPSASDAAHFIKEYHTLQPKKTLLLLIGECMVDYHGRAKSLLDGGTVLSLSSKMEPCLSINQ